MAVLGTLIIILVSIIPIAKAETEIVLDEYDMGLTPTVFGNWTAVDGEAIMGFTVTDDGNMYTVSYNRFFRVIHGPTQVSLIAWGSNGEVRWSHITNHFDRIYCDVTSDQSNIFVVGSWNEDILVEKYSFEGDLIWNSTIDLGQTERGYEICVMGDGTIIVGGSWWPSDQEYPPYDREYLLLALNQTGQTMWSYGCDEYPSPRCDSEYLYITTEGTLQKWDSNGLSDSSAGYYAGRLGCVSGNAIYTISSSAFIERYERVSLGHSAAYPTEVEVTSWNPDTLEELKSSSLMLCNASQELFHYSGIDTAINQDASIRILLQVNEIESWYLINLDQDIELTSFIKLLDGEWFNALLEIDDYRNAYVAATSYTPSFASLTYELTVMKFDAEQILSTETSTSTTGTNGFTDLGTSQMIGVAFIAIVVIDLYLLVLLKQRWLEKT